MDIFSNLSIYYVIGAALVLLGIIGFIVVTATSEISKKRLIKKLSRDY